MPAKKTTEPTPASFTFEHDGAEFTSAPLLDVLSPGFIRRNRHLSSADFTFTLLEALFDGQPDAMEALDAMSWGEFNAVGDALTAQMQSSTAVSLGE